MDLRSSLEALRQHQIEVEAALAAYEAQDLPRENAELLATVTQLRAELEQSGQETARLRQEYDELHRGYKACKLPGWLG